jgi:NAD(P)-dependent dehydrogenase (short-subunit alcohol dehydrogenase family)
MKTALVTGAGARLGRAMALYLGARGYDVAVHYNTSSKGADDVVAALNAAGQRGVAVQADLLNEDETQSLFSRAAEALGGPITCLINNASIFEYDTITTATAESWDRHIGSNLRAPFILTQAMARQGLKPVADHNGESMAAGIVVNMLDQRMRKLTPEFMTYTIAKMGLWAMTQTTAQALAPAIRVNAIGPGPTLQGAKQTAEHFEKHSGTWRESRRYHGSARLFSGRAIGHGAVAMHGWRATSGMENAGCAGARVNINQKVLHFS